MISYPWWDQSQSVFVKGAQELIFWLESKAKIRVHIFWRCIMYAVKAEQQEKLPWFIKNMTSIWWSNPVMMTPSNGNISAVLVLCEGNPPVTSGFPSQMASYTEMFPFDDVIMKTSINTKVSDRWVIEVDNRVSATCVQIRSVNP